MNGLQIIGLVLIGACVVTILAAVFTGDSIGLFIAALVMGIAGNALYWVGKPTYHDDGDQSSQAPPDDQKPENKPPSS